MTVNCFVKYFESSVSSSYIYSSSKFNFPIISYTRIPFVLFYKASCTSWTIFIFIYECLGVGGPMRMMNIQEVEEQ